MNTGSEFLLEFRYSQFLTTIFLIFMYSSGLPLLYPIAFVFFFFTYWFDKLFCKPRHNTMISSSLVLKWHRKPPAYTLHLSNKTRSIMRFSLVPHFFIGLYMYTNSTILTPSEIATQLTSFINSNSRYFNRERFSNIHSYIFLSAIAFFVGLFILKSIIWSLLHRLTAFCRKMQKKVKAEDVASDDFYSELSLF
jgi:hypothetical protein